MSDINTNTFLVEIGTEELPPKALKSLSHAFTRGVEKGLKEQNLSYSRVAAFATPRRLAVQVFDLTARQMDSVEEKLGPAVKAAFDAEGKPTKPAEGFARGCGVSVADLDQRETDKGLRLAFKKSISGLNTVDLLPAIVTDALKILPIPKRMRWGSSRIEFVRPAHWVVMLFGDSVIDCEILGIQADRFTVGHRFHYNQRITLDSSEMYQTALKDPGHVIADFADRQQQISMQLRLVTKDIDGDAVIDDDLLNEVTGLVEWPVALMGKFEDRFLDVPAEALISSMKEHQKYFHINNKQGKLLPYFITIANIKSTQPQQVIAGNERVIRPRLSDAAFFFETDKKSSLESRLEKLKSIVFQAKLGTVFDKSQRVSLLAQSIATLIGANPINAKRAALLSKTDLISEMVLEFTDLQGIMGSYYAANDGEDAEVISAIKEQYLPKFSGDALPSSSTGAAVALADRIDTLVGIFGIGQPPTGSKDPFALRRATIGVLRIIVEKKLNLDLKTCLRLALNNYESLSQDDELIDTIFSYMIERFRAWYEDENIPAEVFQAVAAKQLSEPYDIDQRVHAVDSFTKLPEASPLAAANKRVSNILAKVNQSDLSLIINKDLFASEFESVLVTNIEHKQQEIKPHLASRDYTAALAGLASLKEAIDDFFENVMVMDKDEQLKNNRLAILANLRDLFLEVADISLLAPSK